MDIIIGSGRLGSVLLEMISSESVGIYSRNKHSVKNLLEQNRYVKECEKEDLQKAKRLFLCLPKGEYESFFSEVNRWLPKKVHLYHFATALKESEVRSLTDKGNVIPCKLVGHAKQMYEDKHGLFALPKHCSHVKSELEQLFPMIKIVTASEEEALLANKKTTEAVLKMMVSLELELSNEGLSEEFVKQSLAQTVRGVAKSYLNGDLGGFAKQIIEDVKKREAHEN
ncbi:hypothetical protein [Halalkalibacter urbisdiaboli]|uniref:hypothetical protein n=1 Tax=Halalkalibacter urbisdiaboli TaxID=1960589 RepID=UPI000B42E357|nr:hypothetical protein [Halalkalibacter urbisdiaboli]